jgi:putative transposase
VRNSALRISEVLESLEGRGIPVPTKLILSITNMEPANKDHPRRGIVIDGNVAVSCSFRKACMLDRLTAVHGYPVFIRMDNGQEMTCNAIADWCRFSSSGSAFIEPGEPWQDAFVESFNGKLRNELLAIEEFHTLLEDKVMAEDYRQHHNTYRPHSSLGYRTPNEFTLVDDH